MTPAQEIALRKAMMILAERENRRMRMVCRPAHPNSGSGADYENTVVDRVADALSDNLMTVKEICDLTDARRSGVNSALRKLLHEGKARRVFVRREYLWARSAGASAPVTPEGAA